MQFQQSDSQAMEGISKAFHYTFPRVMWDIDCWNDHSNDGNEQSIDNSFALVV